MRRAALAGTLLLVLSGCTVAGNSAEAGVEQVVVGYQSKTINTVTAGTLLRAKGFLEQRLGEKYDVVWQDYDTFPNFPALKDFLGFWQEKLEGPLFSVTVAHCKLIKPAELKAVDGVFRLH